MGSPAKNCMALIVIALKLQVGITSCTLGRPHGFEHITWHLGTPSCNVRDITASQPSAPPELTELYTEQSETDTTTATASHAGRSACSTQPCRPAQTRLAGPSAAVTYTDHASLQSRRALQAPQPLSALRAGFRSRSPWGRGRPTSTGRGTCH